MTGNDGTERRDARTLAIERLEEVVELLRQPGNEDLAEEVVLEVLDQLTGFCSPRMRLVAAA